MSEVVQAETIQTRLKRIGIYAAVLLFVFLLGFVPMGIRSYQNGRALAQSEQQLSLARMQSNLSAAVIYARRGDYEPARQAASQFFTSLRDEADKGNASIFTAAQKEGIKPLFTDRDELVTLLARSDPAAAEKLSNLYVAYRKIVND